LHRAKAFFRLISATLCTVHLDLHCLPKAIANLISAELSVNHSTLVRAKPKMQAPHRDEVPEFNPGAKEHHWGKRKLKRDA
jgi:hypothetical protein